MLIVKYPNSHLYYWRDNKGVEVDLLVDGGGQLLPVEIKSAQTFQEDYLHSMNQWNNFGGNKGGMLLYDAGQEFVKANGIRIQNWRSLPRV